MSNLSEAIEKLNNFRTWYMGGDISNDVLQKIYKAIDTVLEELNNRIPRKDIEDKIEKVRCETTWNYNDWKYDEKVYRAEHNMITIIEKELLEDKE